MKRAFDIIVAAIGLVMLCPLLLLLALLIKLDSAGPVFFKQERIGKGFRPFFIYKFRTMVKDAPQIGSLITFGNDSRITRVGWFLRRSKLDELPQLFNILKGDMSLVGPRPEVRYYVDHFHREYVQILNVRPGVTDLASLKYRDEASILGKAENPEEEYINHVLPDKIKLAKDYLQRSSIVFDLGVILKTLVRVFDYRRL